MTIISLLILLLLLRLLLLLLVGRPPAQVDTRMVDLRE